MAERSTVLLHLHDPARAERLAAALDADDDWLSVLESAGEPADVTIAQSTADDQLTVRAGEASGEGGAVFPADAEDALLVAAVRLVAAGYAIVPGIPADGDFFEEPPEAGGQRRFRPPLSAREIQVLVLLADGAPNKVIARALDISVHTAKFHVASILSKLGATNRTDAIVMAMREGLVSV